jgi:uncharacterized RDD family membrane protein YckC
MTTVAPGENALDPDINPELYASMRFRRSMAFIIDVVAITVLMVVASVVVFVLGIVTLGLGWLLYFILWPAVAILYYLVAFAGASPRTPGMAFMGIELRMWYGDKPDLLIALAHPILFYLSVTFLTPFIVLVALLSARKRLAHDIVLNTIVVDSDAFRRVAAV